MKNTLLVKIGAAISVALIAGSTGAGAADAAPQASHGYPFGRHSVWRQDVSSARVAAKSSAMVKYLQRTVDDRYGGTAAFNAHAYNTTFYVATPRTRKVRVAFDDCQHKNYVPSGLFGRGGQFVDVPIPKNARAANGTDQEMTVYSPSTDQLWEFWKAKKSSRGAWSACWGGRMDKVSTGPGHFPGYFGATATGLPNAGGMVSLRDVRSGSIKHALSLQVPNTAAYRVSWPAQRSDGWDRSPLAMPEGTRLRLDPRLDVTKLGLTPVGTMVARAAQKYGFIVTDTSGAVAVVGESGAAEEAATGVDPWKRFLNGPDYRVLQNFPWGKLQALPQNWRKP